MLTFNETIAVVIIIAIALTLWLLFNLSLEGRRDLPTLQKIAKYGNLILMIVTLAIIIKNGWWC